MSDQKSDDSWRDPSMGVVDKSVIHDPKTPTVPMEHVKADMSGNAVFDRALGRKSEYSNTGKIETTESLQMLGELYKIQRQLEIFKKGGNPKTLQELRDSGQEIATRLSKEFRWKSAEVDEYFDNIRKAESQAVGIVTAAPGLNTKSD